MIPIDPTPPLVGNPVRQAIASLKGYDYQIWRSVEAWLRLREGEALYLECGEDFDHVDANGSIAVQVKNSTNNITLASEDVREAINHFWDLSERNGDRSVIMHFLTRGGVGLERNRPFGTEKGLEVWQKAALGDEKATESLRRYLTSLEISGRLREFLANASATTLRERLFQRVVWCIGEPSIDAIRESVEDMAVRLGRERAIETFLSLCAVDGLLAYCREVATRDEPIRRILTLERKLVVFEQKTSITLPATPENLWVFAHQMSATEALRQFVARVSGERVIPPSPPGDLCLKPLPKALSDVAEPDARDSRAVERRAASESNPRDYFVASRGRAIDLIDAWAKQYGVEPTDGRHYIYDGHVKLTARNPDTGEMSDCSIWAQATVSAKWEYTRTSGETITLVVKETINRVNSLQWSLDVKIRDGECKTVSTLRNQIFWFPQCSDNFYEREQFYAYMEVVEKLAKEWEPIGFVSFNVGESADLEPVHPESFDIDCEISVAEFKMMHARCSIISLAYELADEWNIGFIFTDEFFSTALCEATIGEVFRCFVSKFGPAPYPEFAASDVVPVNSTHGIRLTLRRGYLRFETVWSRNRLALGIGSV